MITPRERRILQLVADGLSNRTIARQLGYCESAPSRRLSRIYRRFDIHALPFAKRRRRAILMFLTGEVFL